MPISLYTVSSQIGQDKRPILPESQARPAAFPRPVFTRWALVMFNLKRELHANPGRGDLNDLWWGLVEPSEVAQRYLLEAVFAREPATVGKIPSSGLRENR